jgi:hypothetical protein
MAWVPALVLLIRVFAGIEAEASPTRERDPLWERL